MTKDESLHAAALLLADVIPTLETAIAHAILSKEETERTQRRITAIEGWLREHERADEPGVRMVPLVCTCGAEKSHSPYCALKFWDDRDSENRGADRG